MLQTAFLGDARGGARSDTGPSPLRQVLRHLHTSEKQYYRGSCRLPASCLRHLLRHAAGVRHCVTPYRGVTHDAFAPEAWCLVTNYTYKIVTVLPGLSAPWPSFWSG